MTNCLHEYPPLNFGKQAVFKPTYNMKVVLINVRVTYPFKLYFTLLIFITFQPETSQLLGRILNDIETDVAARRWCHMSVNGHR